MLLLGLESSTQVGNISLVQDGQVISYKESPELRKHSEQLNQLIESSLQEHGLDFKEIDRLVIGNGPGSFTGIRVAGNIGKTLSYLNQTPITTMDSLYALQLCPDLKHSARVRLCGINAYKNLIYFAAYSKSECLVEPSVKTPAQIEELYAQENELQALGDGFEVYRHLFSESFYQKLRFVDPKWNYPRSDLMGLDYFFNQKKHSTIDWKSYTPLYLRASEAEENLIKRNS